MKLLTLHNQPYRAESPSLLYQLHYPVTLAYDGRAWLVAVRGVYGLREFRSRDEAAALVAQAFATAQRENLA